MGRKMDKFLLLTWKNWKLQYRRPLQTTVEIVAPVLFSVLLVVLRSLVDPFQTPAQEYEPFQPILSHFLPEQGQGNNTVNTNLEGYMLVYSPTSNRVLDQAMRVLNKSFLRIKGYANSRQLEHHFLTENAKFTLAAIQFDDELFNRSDIPQSIDISLRFPGELRSPGDVAIDGDRIRRHIHGKNSLRGGSAIEKLKGLFDTRDWRTNLLYPIFESPGPREWQRNTGAAPNYYAEGFLALQAVILYALLSAQIEKIPIKTLLRSRNVLPLIQMQRFPFASWKEDPLLPALISFVGMLVMLSFVYTCINTVKIITSEKEKQLKEAMKIMGLPNWLHWTAWFFKCLCFLLITTTCIVVLLTTSWYPRTTYSIFTFANPVILFLFLFFYICATITFCFSVTVFFTKANTAATVAGLLWFLSYAPFLFLQQKYDQLNLFTKLIVSLGSNTAMAYGLQMFLMYESTSEGIQWDNIWKPVTTDDSLTLGFIMIVLVVDAVIYLCIALYVEVVCPGEYGTPQPWYFPFTYSYWCGSPRQVFIMETASSPLPKRNDFFENDPPESAPAIQIKRLRKVFDKKVAVDNLSLNIYENQITALLGHNGAGKTTTMSILTGIIPPTQGTALIQGFDIRTNMKDVRANLGLCPQHNILFDDLTVKEHLYFFSHLKGLHPDEISPEIEKYVALLELEAKIDKKSNTLSGGMKRKLCVGIALCGGSKVVLLDEPTAGMDPSSRRTLWDLLQKQKSGRCILLTTHYMDEADILGDRIAIMANGSVKCYGSSFFLKKKFGTGYHLILDTFASCDPNAVTQLLQKYVPDIRIFRNVGSELVYLLGEDKVAVFESLLADLEKNTENLGVRSYGISLATLEDVFMKVGSDFQTSSVINMEVVKENKSKTIAEYPKPTSIPAKKIPLLTGFQLIINQFLAMFMKKILSIARTRLLQLIQVLIPITFLIVAIVVSRNMDKNKTNDLPKLPLTLEPYRDPVVVVQNDFENVYSQMYFEIVSGYQVENVTSIPLTMLHLSNIIPSTVKRKYIVGASFTKTRKNETTLTAWFNNNPYHTSPLALGLVLNSVYKSFLGKSYSINFAAHPLPFTPDTKLQRLMKGNGMGFQLAFNIAFSMSFVSSFYILFTVRERVCKSKHLQFASGVKSYIFWTTSFICDLATFVVTILALLITLFCFQEEGYTKESELGRLFFLLFCFGIAVLPLMYIASYLFDIPSTGYTRMTLFSVFTGVTAFLVIQILATPTLLLQHIAEALHWGFLFMPHYSLATGIRDTYVTFVTSKMCNFFVTNCLENEKQPTIDKCWKLACYSNISETLTNLCCERDRKYFKWSSPGVAKNILYSLSTGLFLFLLLILSEHKIWTKLEHYIFRNGRKKTLEKAPDEDDDVLEEKKKIRTTPENQMLKEYSLVLKDMTKYYPKFLAVNAICLGVGQYECFGLLGINGAGKTSTFKMITGDTTITSGNAWVHTFSVKTHLAKVQKVIGYCPQFDALLTDLTAKETVIMFALLRGIPFKECKYVTGKLAQEFDFVQHLNKRIRKLSGGNKRKISTAISLVGDPPVICLDEPTAGMDPVTKRNLWNAICGIRDSGKCILFTSHSMEECEALCTRLAIMVNGDFKCIGSLQHLKNKFAAGYTLTVKVKRSIENGETQRSFEDIEKFIAEHFPTAKQQEKHQELISYYIVDKNIRLSEMFGILEDAKNRLNIEDYALGQATLEQIFLTLTKLQR